jgi:hypothetical protein
MKVPLRSLSDIKNGDCVVTFSRRDIYKLKVNFHIYFFLHEIQEIYAETSFEHLFFTIFVLVL